MRTLRAGEILHLWEQAEGLPPVERALSLAAAAGGDPAALRDEPVGRTHERLLALREELLGPSLAATASCPGCGSRVEFTLDAAVLRHQPAGPSTARESQDGVSVAWRSPTPADLTAAAGERSAEHELRRRCLTVLPEGADVPAPLLDRVEAAMADSDPLAEVLAQLICPDCGREFASDLDVGSFVWAEVAARAARLLHEVDALARVYGWTEDEVLALSDHRRGAYLRIVSDGAP